MHLVMVYDPLTGEMFKKIIAVQIKPKNKDFYPQMIDIDFKESGRGVVGAGGGAGEEEVES